MVPVPVVLAALDSLFPADERSPVAGNPDTGLAEAIRG
jgi:hypothetical protein